MIPPAICISACLWSRFEKIRWLRSRRRGRATRRRQGPGYNRPHCLNGQSCVECRGDAECKSGRYCESGTCRDCVQDRHCGPRCRSCGVNLVLTPDGASVIEVRTDTPICHSLDGTAEKAICVRCVADSDCGDNGQCDPATHECTNKCDPPCEAGLRCHGGRCVECYNSSQCLCGACDIAAGTCTEACHNNADCMGNQCCIRTTGKCQPGRCSGTAGGALCDCAMAGPQGSSLNTAALLPADVEVLSLGGPAALLAVALCALGLRRRLPRAAA